MSTLECLLTFLFIAALGFVAGIVLGATGDGPHWSRFGWDVCVILRARNYSPQPESRFPLLPGGVLVALLLSAVPLLGSEDCRGFLDRHLLFSLALLACGISTAAWLVAALGFRQVADAERRARIEQFLSDSAAPSPVRAERSPIWLGVWNGFNVALFVVLMVVVILSLGDHPILRGER